MITLSHSAGGGAISPRSSVIIGWAASSADTAAENPSRSTASAPPAGTWFASAVLMMSESEPAHFGVQQADGIVLMVIGTKRIRTHQFCIAISFMDRGCAQWAHFMQDNRNPGLRQLPGRLRTGQAAANDMNGLKLFFVIR